MCIIDPTTGRYNRTTLSINAIIPYAFTSAVTDGKYIYALGGSNSDSVDRMLVIDPELLKITKPSILEPACFVPQALYTITDLHISLTTIL